jgi:uncharacterized RDD family membrane protein YckC
MSEELSPQEGQIRGYLSEVSKRRFTITAGILGTVFLIAQFALPMAAMVGVMLSSPEAFEVDFARRHPHHAAVWDGKIWFVETEPGFGDDPDTSSLLRTSLGEATEPETMISSLEGTPYLLAGSDRLWLISKKSLAYFKEGRVVTIDQPGALGEFSRPFLLEGRPATLERWPTELALVVHDGTSWQPRATLPVIMPDPECGCGLDRTKAVASDHDVHVFLQFGTTLYYGLWDPDLQTDIEWEAAGEVGRDWSPVIWRGEPAVIGMTTREDGDELFGKRRNDGAWTEELRLCDWGDALVSAHRNPASDSLIVFVGSTYSSSVAVLDINDDGNVQDSWIGEHSKERDFLPNFMWFLMTIQYGSMILLPLILAVILSAMMRRHRVTTYSSGPQEQHYASLTRRAVAQLIDLAIMAGPTIVSFALFMRITLSGVEDDPQGFWDGVAFFAPILAAMGWALVTALIFTYTEGRTGVTPGKWVARIRVLGTDLQPCGFGRALIRNLLKCVDGFFNFMVGIMVVALSENWQRVGDMAARTVVVSREPGIENQDPS